MAPTCTNCGGTEFVWADELKTGGTLARGPLSVRAGGELPLGTRICRGCGHADLFLRNVQILQSPHHWRPGEFTPISGGAKSARASHEAASGHHAAHAPAAPAMTAPASPPQPSTSTAAAPPITPVVDPTPPAPPAIPPDLDPPLTPASAGEVMPPPAASSEPPTVSSEPEPTPGAEPAASPEPVSGTESAPAGVAPKKGGARRKSPRAKREPNGT